MKDFKFDVTFSEQFSAALAELEGLLLQGSVSSDLEFSQEMLFTFLYLEQSLDVAFSEFYSQYVQRCMELTVLQRHLACLNAIHYQNLLYRSQVLSRRSLSTPSFDV